MKILCDFVAKLKVFSSVCFGFSHLIFPNILYTRMNH